MSNGIVHHRQKWEYKAVKVLVTPNIEKNLCSLGEECWEIISAQMVEEEVAKPMSVMDGGVLKEVVQMARLLHLIMKRPKDVGTNGS